MAKSRRVRSSSSRSRTSSRSRSSSRTRSGGRRKMRGGNCQGGPCHSAPPGPKSVGGRRRTMRGGYGFFSRKPPNA